jgi:hypothetical protein
LPNGKRDTEILSQLKLREKVEMKSKTSKQRRESNYSAEMLRVVIITLLIAASLIALATLLSVFKQMLLD